MLYYHGGGGTPPAADDLLGDSLKSAGLSRYKELSDGLKDLTKTIQTMDASASKFVKTMGLTAESSLGLKKNLNASYSSIVDLGGKMSDAVDLQEGLFKASGRNLILLKSQSDELFAASSVSGIGSEKLQESFYDAGMEVAHIAENIFKVSEVSNQMGVNAQAVSAVVTANLDKLNRYGFTNGVEGLAKMAGKAQALKFDVNETFQLAEQLMSPEKAIEIGAAIQRLGGASSALTDPLRLMDLAQNNLPELQNELGKLAKQYTYFNEETQSFQIMKGAKNQLREVANELGIGREEFEKLALNSANLNKKMSEMRFGFDVPNEDKELLANLAQLEDVGGGQKEYKVTYFDKDGAEQTKRLADISTTELEIIKQSNQAKTVNKDDPAGKQLIDMAKGQLGEYGKLVAAQEKIANTITNTIGGSKLGQELLVAAREEFESTASSVSTAFGTGSEFESKLNSGALNIDNTTKLLAAMVTGDFKKVIDQMVVVSSIAGAGVSKFVTDEKRKITGALSDTSNISQITDMNVATVGNITFAGSISEIKTLLGGDTFREPRYGGDTLKTPSGDIVLHDKDYFLAATQLPDVLQKSVNKGVMDVLKLERQSLNSVMQTTNTQTQPQTQPQKQEVVHTVNFKVSVDTPRNKLTDMLVEELPKNPTLMQYIVKHFDNTKTSGGMVAKK
jgi:hypothetical protein